MKILFTMRRGSAVERCALIAARFIPGLSVMAARVGQDYTSFTHLLWG